MKITLGLLIVHEGKNIEKYSEVSGGIHEKGNLCVQKKYKREMLLREYHVCVTIMGLIAIGIIPGIKM